MWTVVLGFCVFNAAEVGALHVIGPVVADETIGRRMWGVFLAMETAGMVAGALIAMRLRVRRLLLVGVACCLGGALWLVGLALFPAVAVLLPAAFITGIAMEQFGVAWDVSIQEHIPADKLARVYSYDAVGSFLAIPIGQVAAGPIAEQVGPRVGTARRSRHRRGAVVGDAAQPAGADPRARGQPPQPLSRQTRTAEPGRWRPDAGRMWM